MGGPLQDSGMIYDWVWEICPDPVNCSHSDEMFYFARAFTAAQLGETGMPATPRFKQRHQRSDMKRYEGLAALN